MPTEAELEQRRLDLHERELALREAEFDERTRKKKINFASMLPLPLAAAIASGAVTLWQFNEAKTQQNYEREIEAVRYYLDNRDQKFAFDTNGPQSAIEAMRMLKQMSKPAFAVVKCDLWNRAYLQIPPDQYESYKTALEKVLFSDAKSAAQAGADAAYCRDVPTTAQGRPRKPPPATASDKAAAKAGATPAGPAASSAAPAAAGAEVPSLYRVFVQVGPGRQRKLDLLLGEGPMEAIEEEGFVFASRGTATIGANLRHAEIRYFGPAQQAMAKELEEAFEKAFADERLDFHLRPTGDMFPDLPKQDIEVLIPDPAQKS